MSYSNKQGCTMTNVSLMIHFVPSMTHKSSARQYTNHFRTEHNLLFITCYPDTNNKEGFIIPYYGIEAASVLGCKQKQYLLPLFFCSHCYMPVITLAIHFMFFILHQVVFVLNSALRFRCENVQYTSFQLLLVHQNKIYGVLITGF